MKVNRVLKFKNVGTCIECTSHKTDAYGYPRIYHEGKSVRLGRFIYEAIHGKTNLQVHHICFNRKCCAPYHMIALHISSHMSFHSNEQKRLLLGRKQYKVAQIHPIHGVLKIWPTTWLAGTQGFQRSKIRAVIVGERDYHAACWWMKVEGVLV